MILSVVFLSSHFLLRFRFATAVSYGAFQEPHAGLEHPRSAQFPQGWLPRVLAPRWGEARMLKVGIFFELFGFLLFAFATQSWMIYAVIVIWSVSGVVNPAIQSMLSSRTPANAQGELQTTDADVSDLLQMDDVVFVRESLL